MKKLAAIAVVAAAVACSSNPVPYPPPPVVPGIPGQHWQLCLRLVEAAVTEVVFENPYLKDTPAQDLACIRMRAAAECGYAFERIASENTPILVGEWCPPDFKESMDRFIDSRCSDVPSELVEAILEEIRGGMARRIGNSLRQSGRGKQ